MMKWSVGFASYLSKSFSDEMKRVYISVAHFYQIYLKGVGDVIKDKC